jgi:hypothetical protein
MDVEEDIDTFFLIISQVVQSVSMMTRQEMGDVCPNMGCDQIAIQASNVSRL